MRVVENLLGMTSLLAQAAAVGLALHLGAMLLLVWRREGDVPPWGASEALRPQLLGLLLGVVMVTAAAPLAAWLVLAPFVSWALGWHHARRDDATPLEVPAEGDPWLAVYRVAGMMAAGAAPAALARFELGPAVDGAALVLPAVGLAIGVARASSGAPAELPQLLALVLAAHPREEDPEPARRGEPGGRPPKPTGRPAAPIGRTVVPEPTVDEASVVAAAAAAAAPVDDGAESEGRAFARRLAQQALEAQLRVIRREEARAAAAAAAEREVSEAEAQATREAAARERAAAAAAAAASAREAAAAAARAAEIAEAAAVAAAAEVGEAPIVVVLAERADDGG